MRARGPSIACALALVGARASAEESRFNVHLQVGPNFTVLSPDPPQSMDKLRLAGFHLRGGLEYSFLERVGAEVGYGIDLAFTQGGTTRPYQTIFAGARVRPWFHPTGGYMLPRPAAKDAKPLYVGDLFSDAWIDAHVGVSLAADRTRFLYDVGVGTRVAVIAPLQLGLFVRFQHLVPDQVIQVLFGVTIDLGFLPVRSVDQDGDGVVDSADKCPGTPRGTRVNDYGCEWRESGTKETKCGDTDLDGVCDGHDDCPDTRMGTQVDKKGCPVGGAGDAETPPQQ